MRRLTETEKARIRELAAEKQTTRMIGADIGRAHRSVWGYLEALRRPAPRPRVRSPLRLSLGEREEISRGLAGGESLRVIAAQLGRAPSTVSREVAANGGRRRYRACRADERSLRRARRPKVAKLARCERLRAIVEAKPSSCAGRHSRSRDGWYEPSPTTRRCGCPTRPSTGRCSCKPGVRYARNSPATCAAATSRVARADTRPTTARVACAGSSTSASDPLMLRIGRCPVIGKATCCAANG